MAAAASLPVGRAYAGISESIALRPGRVVPQDPAADVSRLKLTVQWSGNICRPVLTNTGSVPMSVKEVVLFEYKHSLPPDTALYGESFQMLSQTTGTLASPVTLGLGDGAHYRIPQPADATTVTSLLTLSPPGKDHILLAYTSCRKFIGRFYLRAGSIEAVVDTEGLTLAPGEAWQLEEFIRLAGPDRNELLTTLAQRLGTNHPNPMYKLEPTGWCSYYCFGTKATTEQVYANLDTIAKTIPELRYIQIDDGYQPAMGDWLEPGPAFGGDIAAVLKQIRQRGLEPALWVAPFIAGSDSRVLAEHPDWFIQGADGKPLPAASVTFTGWGGGGWYALDGTNPAVQDHFTALLRTMREDWGCAYFKLDANFWGAMHGGRLHDPKATRIEAYRCGMEAIRRGTGDAFVLGCNHPIWPSLGLIHGSRSSGDIKRTWTTFRSRAQESLNRNWQNGRLWWNDPDAVLLTGTLSENEHHFHATSAFASGGMILSGDDLTTITPGRLSMLRKLLPPGKVAAIFDDPATLEVGRTTLDGQLWLSAFNSSDLPRTIHARLPGTMHVTDIWSGSEFGKIKGTLTLSDMPPHSARLLRCVPAN